VIPKGKPLVKEYVERLSTPQSDPDPKFLDFALRMVDKLFRPGWDRDYIRHSLTSSLPMSACAEVGKKGGGSRGWAAHEREERAEFCSYVMDSVAPRERGVSRVDAILTGGKWRIISIPPKVDNALRPLHKAIYSHLSRFDWLLRGDAKASAFKDFTLREGEVFVSGDYESATDNLNARLQEAILNRLLERASSIPLGIAQHAIATYRSVLVHDGIEYTQARGQLMGQLTSFPLLCLINYITFRYSVRRPGVPVRINGDDIVFRATPDEATRWERNVAKGGLTLSVGKTLKNRKFFTLNSTPFEARQKCAAAVGFIRASALFTEKKITDQVMSLNGRFYSACAGYGRVRKLHVREAFVDLNQRAIHASRRSVTRGLGLAVERSTLHAVGLWHRELFYLEQVEEKPVPMVARGELPSGFAQVSKSWIPKSDLRAIEDEWSWACTEHAWFSDFTASAFSDKSMIDLIREGCSPYGLGCLASARVRRMLKLSRSALWRWIYARSNESVFGRVRPQKAERVFVNVDRLSEYTPVIQFTRGCETEGGVSTPCESAQA
jgi:hypothetical protein